MLNTSLPFYSYGLFKPGEISFLGIKDYINKIIPLNIKGCLLLRDGITLYKDGIQTIEGYLIKFRDEDSEKAYEYIESLEPKNLFYWKELIFNDNKFNILYGRRPDRGSESFYEATGKIGWDDPYFTSAIELLNETIIEEFNPNLKPLFKIQMNYLLLWTLIERFTFLRYSFGGNPIKRIQFLSKNLYFIEGLNKYVTQERSLFSTENPEDKIILNKNNPEKSLMYYYQVRCNITHRGKGINKDYETVRNSFNSKFN